MARRTLGSRIYLSLIGLALAAAGGVFCWLMAESFLRARDVAGWPRVPCLMLESEIERRGEFGRDEWRFDPLYQYEWEGEMRTGDRFRLRGSSWTQRRDEVEELVALYPVGTVRECLVNPANPTEALLRGESRAPGYSIWFPALIAVGGLGIVVGAWRR